MATDITALLDNNMRHAFQFNGRAFSGSDDDYFAGRVRYRVADRALVRANDQIFQ
jgi:hypothetical protein